MFTNEQADYLIDLPKKILANDELLNQIQIQQEYPFSKKFILGSSSDFEFTFLLDITQSEKKALKVSLHYQEDQIGRRRVGKECRSRWSPYH